MAARLGGEGMLPSEIVQLLRNTGVSGAKAVNLPTSGVGFSKSVDEAKLLKLLESASPQNPIIANVRRDPLGIHGGHAVVVRGVKDGKVMLFDPWEGLQAAPPWEVFYEELLKSSKLILAK